LLIFLWNIVKYLIYELIYITFCAINLFCFASFKTSVRFWILWFMCYRIARYNLVTCYNRLTRTIDLREKQRIELRGREYVNGRLEIVYIESLLVHKRSRHTCLFVDSRTSKNFWTSKSFLYSVSLTSAQNVCMKKIWEIVLILFWFFRWKWFYFSTIRIKFNDCRLWWW